MTLSSLSLLQSLGPALAVAVAVTLTAGLTLIPAVVSLLGTRVFWPSRAWKTEPSGAGSSARPGPGQLGRRPGSRPAIAAMSGVGSRLGGHAGQRDAVLEVWPQDQPTAKRFRAAGLAERGQRRLVRCASM
jgi:uncharacterized membrane protein YdfJ with MMPL/SSD domain